MQWCAAATLLGSARAEVPELIRRLSDPDGVVRTQAAGRLLELDQCAAPALPTLRARLDDPDVFVRVNAAAAVLAIRDNCPQSKTILLAAFDQYIPNVQVSALRKVPLLPDPEFAVANLKRLSSGPESPARRTAIDVLSVIDGR